LPPRVSASLRSARTTATCRAGWLLVPRTRLASGPRLERHECGEGVIGIDRLLVTRGPRAGGRLTPVFRLRTLALAWTLAPRPLRGAARPTLRLAAGLSARSLVASLRLVVAAPTLGPPTWRAGKDVEGLQLDLGRGRIGGGL